MRSVLFKKWIPKEILEPSGLCIIKKGTNCWEADFVHEGLFHQWASAYEESSEGFGNYTVGLIELSDGTIEEILPSNIKFTDKLDFIN